MTPRRPQTRSATRMTTKGQVQPARDARHALAPWAQRLLDHMVEAYGTGHVSRSLTGAKTCREGRGMLTSIERLLHGGKANEKTVRRMEQMLEKYR